MRRQGKPRELQGDEQREPGRRAGEDRLSGPRGWTPSRRSGPPDLQAAWSKNRADRACPPLRWLGPRGHPARSDRMAAEEPDGHDADAEDREPQAVRQGHRDADRHERDGEADEPAPAIASGKVRPSPQKRPRRPDRCNTPSRSPSGRAKRGRPPAERRCSWGRDGNAHQQEAQRRQMPEAGVAEMHADRGAELVASVFGGSRLSLGNAKADAAAQPSETRPTMATAPRQPPTSARALTLAKRPPMPPSVLPAI